MVEQILYFCLAGLAVLTVIYWCIVVIDTFVGLRSIKILNKDLHTAGNKLPKVSIIITAKNEEDSIGQSLKSLRTLSYYDYEVIVVNDRSTDRTLDEIEKLEKNWPELKVISIDALPSDWLGKNYACYRGYSEATGDLLLFTDADVIFDPDSLRIAVTYFTDSEADHLAMSPTIYGNSFFLKLFVKYFFFSFLIYFRPWSGGMGVGAFNMFSRQAYEKIGTHEAVALRPDEDLQLGKRVKRNGLRQYFASGKQLLSVEWYTSLRDAMQGIEKNAFAGLQYSSVIAIGAVAGQVLIFLFPYVAIFLTSGWIQLLYITVIILMWSVYIRHTTLFSRSKPYDVIFLPIAAGLFIYTVSRALVKTIIYGGIYWRGTFYSLRDLKRM